MADAATVPHTGLRVVADVLRVPGVRVLELAAACSRLSRATNTVAFVVFAYQAGGPQLVALYGLARNVPAMFGTPLLAALSDRVPVERILTLSTAVRMLLGLAAAIWVAQGWEPLVVIALAALDAAVSGLFRPLQAASLPWLTRTPAEVSAANVVSTMTDNVGVLVGPLLAGAALLLAGPAAAMGIAAGWLLVAWLLLSRLHVPRMSLPQSGSRSRPVREALDGLRLLARMAPATRLSPPGGLAILIFVQTVVRGVLLVVVAVLAVDTFRLGDAAVGWLTATMGLGGLTAGFVASRMVRLRRLARTLLVGVALWGVPLAVLGGAPSPVVAYLALFVVGFGNALEDASAYMLVPRLAGPAKAGRATGAIELLAYAGIGGGSLIASTLVEALDVRAVLVGSGLSLVVLTALFRHSLAQIDRAMPEPGPAAGLLQRLPIFAPLPLVVIEHLETALRPRTFEAGQVVVAEGELGDGFHLIASGRAAVSVGGVSRPSLGPGDGFGEIALLRDVPRTATVVATEPLLTYVLPRPDFLAAVGFQESSASAASEIADRHLETDLRGAPGRGPARPSGEG